MKAEKRWALNCEYGRKAYRVSHTHLDECFELVNVIPDGAVAVSVEDLQRWASLFVTAEKIADRAMEGDFCDAVSNEVAAIRALLPSPEVDSSPADDLLHTAWVIIANAYGGDWDTAPNASGWKKAAERWRNEYHKTLSAPEQESNPDVTAICGDPCINLLPCVEHDTLCKSVIGEGDQYGPEICLNSIPCVVHDLPRCSHGKATWQTDGQVFWLRCPVTDFCASNSAEYNGFHTTKQLALEAALRELKR